MTVWPNGTQEMPKVSSDFGPRNLNNPLASTDHRGVDMYGFPIVHSIDPGTVVYVGEGTAIGWRPVAGFMIVVQHDGYFSRYLHNERGTARVKVGDRVDEGEALVDMGWSGLAHAWDEHSHLEVTPGQAHHRNVGQVDPVDFITNRIIGTEIGNIMSNIERLEKVIGGTVARAENGESISQRLDISISLQRETIAAIDRLATVIGGTVERGKNGDSLSQRLDKIVNQTK